MFIIAIDPKRQSQFLFQSKFLSELFKNDRWQWNSSRRLIEISFGKANDNSCLNFSVTIMCLNDELSSMMNWIGYLQKDSELFILFAENSQILPKISVIPILLTLIYLVALNLFVINQLNSSSNSTHHCGT